MPASHAERSEAAAGRAKTRITGAALVKLASAGHEADQRIGAGGACLQVICAAHRWNCHRQRCTARKLIEPVGPAHRGTEIAGTHATEFRAEVHGVAAFGPGNP